MRISKLRLIVLGVICAWTMGVQAQIGMPALGDSLTVFTGFSRVWSPAVRVKSMRINGNKVVLRTNGTLRDYRWTPASLDSVRHMVSRLVLGHERGQVMIYSANSDIATLVTECAKSPAGSGKCPFDKCTDLTERTIALYPSHGMYFNQDRNEWIWQRATLWTTVEDLYSYEYVRLIKQMLENAGATVMMPRADLSQSEPGKSGMPRWAEGARYWLENQGADSTLWDLYDGNEYKDDMKCRAMWVNSLQTPVDLCLAVHTDGLDSGDDTTIVGTLVIYTARDDEGHPTLRDGRDREHVNRNLADWVQTQLVEDLRHIAPEWTRRQLKEANYCETRVPVVPSLILEILSHKNMADMRYGLDPKFRFAASRAIYKGLLRYLNGSNAIVQPLAVEQLAIHPDGVLEWQAPIDSLEPSATPSYYMVYVQADDGEWDVQQVEQTTRVALDLKPGVRYSYYVVAGNDGGLSFPSPTISSYFTDNARTEQMALIVDGFDDVYGPQWFADSTYAGIVPGSYACEAGFSCAYIGAQWDYTRAHAWQTDDQCGWGSCYRDHAGQITVGNTRDWSVRHGRELQKQHIGYVSCTEGMLAGYLPEQHYRIVDYVCGRQRCPLSRTTQEKLDTYLNAGGRLLLSTDHFSAIPTQWAKRTLHTSYYAEQATRSGRIAVPGHRPYHLVLAPNEEQLFSCTPEGLKPEKGAEKIATYEDMRCPAGVGYAHRILVYGFPLEAVQEFDKIYKQAIEWLIDEKEKLTDL